MTSRKELQCERDAAVEDRDGARSERDELWDQREALRAALLPILGIPTAHEQPFSEEKMAAGALMPLSPHQTDRLREVMRKRP